MRVSVKDCALKANWVCKLLNENYVPGIYNYDMSMGEFVFSSEYGIVFREYTSGAISVFLSNNGSNNREFYEKLFVIIDVFGLLNIQ